MYGFSKSYTNNTRNIQAQGSDIHIPLAIKLLLSWDNGALSISTFHFAHQDSYDRARNTHTAESSFRLRALPWQ